MSDTTEQIKVTVENGVKELIIRHGEAVLIPVYHGYKLEGGAISVVQEYLSKASATHEEIKNSFITYSYEDLFLKLVFDCRLRAGSIIDHADRIDGVLKLHPELEKWKINKDKAYDNMSLSHFIKMNRHFFENKDIAMQLVGTLRDIRVKAESIFETSDDKRGNARELIAQKLVESNIPDSFNLKLPIFVGEKPQTVAVEIEINPKDFGCSLVSPDLKEIIDLETRAIIDAELNAIRVLYPDLKIFQK